MYRLILLALSLPSIYCLIGGDHVEWSSRPYLVKVAASVEDDNHLGCTGVLISPTLVLTTARCFPEREGRSDDAIVISIRGNGTRSWKRATVSVKKNKDFALLTLQPKLHDHNPCSYNGGTPIIERLPISSNLLSLPSIDDIPNYSCRVVGFRTVEAADYATNNDVLEFRVRLEKDEDKIITKLQPGEGPCFDDYGVPLECMLDENEAYTLVGFIQSITQDEGESDSSTASPLDICKKLNGIQFNVFNEDHHLMKLWKKQFPEILAIQSECFSGEEEE